MSSINRFSEPVIKARSRIALNHTFYSVLMLGMRTENTNMGGQLWSFGTNGRSIFVNDDECRNWSIPHLIFGFAHECVHVMTGDMWMARELGLKHDIANIAQDYWINQTLVDEGLIMPPKGLLDAKFKGWSKLQIYKFLIQNPGYGSSSGKKGGSPSGNPMQGDVIPSDEKGSENLKAEIGIRVKQAAQAAKAIGGHIPEWASDMIDDLRKPKVAWQQRLMHLAQIAVQAARDDYSYRRHNRRYVPQGLIVPSLYNPKGMGWVALFADTSGSMSEEELNAGYSEAAGIIEQCNPARFTVADIDTRVRHVREYKAGDRITKIKAHGRGGTMFRPAFDWIADPENNKGEKPALVIYFTDMEGEFPTETPPYPVIWLSTSPEWQQPHFGEVIDIT